MKTKYIMIAAFALTIAAQAFVPAKMVYDSEMTERQGTVFKFKTEPIDPADPFRGKYVVLNYSAGTFETDDTEWNQGEVVYAVLGKDAQGFAKIVDVLRDTPQTGSTYITVKVSFYEGKKLYIDLPFNRFYMEESKAYEAESGYREYSGQVNAKPAYALVAVQNGNAVLKDVIIDNIPVKNYVLRKRALDRQVRQK